jgi:hypothetical protein
MDGRRISPAIRLHADELKTEIADPLEKTVKLRLVAHLTGKRRRCRTSLQEHALKSRPKSFTEPAADADLIRRWLHLTSAHYVLSHCRSWAG